LSYVEAPRKENAPTQILSTVNTATKLTTFYLLHL